MDRGGLQHRALDGLDAVGVDRAPRTDDGDPQVGDLAVEQRVDHADRLVGRARRHDLADQTDLRTSADQAREVLDRRPCPVGVARQLVTTYRTWPDQLTEGPA